MSDYMTRLPNLKVDIPALRELVESKKDEWRRLYGSQFYGFKIDTSLPPIQAIIDQLAVKPKGGLFLKLLPKTDSGIHRDDPVRLAALNIIVNERLGGSVVAFYKDLLVSQETQPEEKWLSTDRVPVLLNTQACHRALNVSDEPRMVLSLTYLTPSYAELSKLHAEGKLLND